MTLDGNSGAVGHQTFDDLLTLVSPNDLLVFNNTRVIPARLWGHKASGGRVEILVERVTSPDSAVAHVRSSKSPRPGTVIELSALQGGEAVGEQLEVTGRTGALFELRNPTGQGIADVLLRHGHMPLPPYIHRADESTDRERYQTVYASRDGAVAAPTAGLHFTPELLEQLEAKGVRRAEVTLHVGAGTFLPVRTEHIEEHEMHAEFLEVEASVCEAVMQTRERGGRVIAVGTTAVRALETAARATGTPRAYRGDTQIFLYPGVTFQCVDAMVTNFHLPESTLLMLVSAFAGREHVLSAYAEAVDARYRFFSYGDAMLITAADASRGAR